MYIEFPYKEVIRTTKKAKCYKIPSYSSNGCDKVIKYVEVWIPRSIIKTEVKLHPKTEAHRIKKGKEVPLHAVVIPIWFVEKKDTLSKLMHKKINAREYGEYTKFIYQWAYYID